MSSWTDKILIIGGLGKKGIGLNVGFRDGELDFVNASG